MKQLILLLVTLTILCGTSAERLFADGGFQTNTSVPCYSGSWVYKGSNKVETTYTKCISVSEVLPFPLNKNSQSATLSPIDLRTDKTKWCPTEERYNTENALKQSSWGYCLDKDIEFPVNKLDSSIYADGGYQTAPVKCIEGPWSFKEKLSNGDNSVTTLTGCVSLSSFKPYPLYDSKDSAEIKNLQEPVSANTNKGKWCPVLRDVYNPTPVTDLSNRLNWGYCLDNTIPSVVVPTASPTNTPAPVLVPSTSSPTPAVATPTKSPTPAPTSKPTVFLAAGKQYAHGGMTSTSTSLVECLDSWTFKNNDENILDDTLSGCISMNQYSPWPIIDGLTTGLIEPTDKRASKTKWCATRSVYNPYPENTANRLQWGYCLEAEAVVNPTSLPTPQPTPLVTFSPTLPPEYDDLYEYIYTDSPNVNPTPTPTTKTSTRNPTVGGKVDGPKDGDSNNVQNGDGSSVGQKVGVSIAVVLVVVALVLGAVLMQNTYRKKQLANNEDARKKEEEPKKSNMF